MSVWLEVRNAVDDRNEPKLPKFRCFGLFRFGEIQTYRNETQSCIQQYILRKMEHLGNPKNENLLIGPILLLF